MRHPWLLAMACGCGSPISNLPFAEEAGFFAPLPSPDNIGPPANVQLAPNADNPLLAAGKQAAAEYAQLVAYPLQIGAWLRQLGPDVRTDARRTWEASELLVDPPAALTTGEERVSAWVRADVLRPLDAPFVMTIEVAPRPDGPWMEILVGEHDGDATGELQWDVGATVSALSLDPPEPRARYVAQYEPSGPPEDVRVVNAALGDLPLVDASWIIGGDQLLAFSGALPVMADGTSRAGNAVVFHDATGGWAEGSVLDGDISLAFAACWDSLGTLTFAGGDAGVFETGDVTTCPPSAFSAE